MYEIARKHGMVRFALRPGGNSRVVAVAGDFNRWEPIAMKKQKDGIFVRNVPIDQDTFEYKFLVDGQWVQDPDQSTWAVNNYGTINSVGRLQ